MTTLQQSAPDKAYTVETVPTPALVIDEAVTDHNLGKLADYARQHNLNIRPHTKTHKSLVMARKQLTIGGCYGLTVAKVGELEVMSQVCDDLLLAYPALDPARTRRIAAVAKRCTVRVSVDSAYAVDRLAEAAKAAGVELGILVDVDMGMHRTGLQTPQEALALAQHIDQTDHVRLDGLFCYPGHLTQPEAEMIAALQAIDQKLHEVLNLWKQHGLEARIVSGGSTPAAYYSHHVTAYTEIRPGTYIYNDRNVAGGTWCGWDECAAKVIATVVSSAVPGKFVIDAGNKTLTSDRYMRTPDDRNHGRVVSIPDAIISRLSEEHGEVTLPAGHAVPPLGSRVEVIMNHVCPCVNLFDQGWLKKADGTLEPLVIDARGKLS